MSEINNQAQLYVYNAESVETTVNSAQHFIHHFSPLENLNKTHWLNFHSMEDKEGLLELTTRFGLDKLVQEHLFCGEKHPRLEEYHDYIYFSLISALPSKSDSYELSKERIAFMMGDNYLISFQEKKSDHFPLVRNRIEENRGKIRAKGPDFLLYRMIEAIMDNYTEVIDEMVHSIEILDKLVLRSPKKEVLLRSEWEKRKLMDLRKVLVPMKEILLQIDRVENNLIVEENNNYFKELYHKTMILMEEVEVQKQMLDGIASLYFAAQGQKMNEIMKVLTVISAVFIPLTFIVGVYGMNFDNMPELKWKYGYFIILGGMFLLAVGLIFVFAKRGWLRKN